MSCWPCLTSNPLWHVPAYQSSLLVSPGQPDSDRVHAVMLQLPGSPQHAAVQAAQKLLTSVPKHMLHEDPRAAPMILEECRLSLASKAELLLLRLPLEEPAVVLLQLSSWTQAQVHRPHSAA